MNKSGKDLFGWTDSMEIFSSCISDTKVKSFKVDNEILTVEMSDNGLHLAVIYKNSKGDVYSTDGKKLFAFETTVNHLMNNRLVRFFPSGNYFLAVVKNNNAMIYDSSGSILFDLKGHTGRVNSLDVSPDGRFIVTASCDKSALIWNFNFNTHKFSPYDTIIRYKDKTLYSSDTIFGPTDTLWSCEFNNTGKYILTTSADSLLSIWDLNGNAQFEFFNFFMNSIYGNCGYGPTFQPRLRSPEKHFLYMPYFYQKVYDARFATNHGAIIATNYSYNITNDCGPDGIFRSQVIYWDDQSSEAQQLSNDFSLMAQRQSDSLQFHSYRSWEITSDNRILASVFNYRDGIMLIASGGYQMLSIPGDYPKFTVDGKYLFYVHQKTISILPLNISQIRSLVFGEKIFGNPKNGNDIWKIY
jgi:WD40 repeat protein